MLNGFESLDSLVPLAPLVPLVAAKPARKKRPKLLQPAPENPIARVVLTDLPTAILDREFDFLVPANLADTAQPGVRVRLKFQGKTTLGFIVARLNSTDHSGELAYLTAVVSPQKVLPTQAYNLVKSVAEYYAGTTADVLRFAVPPRHGQGEAKYNCTELNADDSVIHNNEGDATPLADSPTNWDRLWNNYQGGAEFLANIGETSGNRIAKYIWTSLPGLAPSLSPQEIPSIPLWAAEIAIATKKVISANRQVLIVAPDKRDVDRIVMALAQNGVPESDIARYVTEGGPAARYESFLRAANGLAKVIIGTRSTAFVPLANPGLLILWGDGEETLIEPQTPYYNAREVLRLRAEQQKTTLLLGGIGRTVAVQAWLETTPLTPDPLPVIELAPTRQKLRGRAPLVRLLNQATLASERLPGRIPSAAWRAIHDGLVRGPVLVQVPRTGYLPMIACAKCREQANCHRCSGALKLTAGGAQPYCTTCQQEIKGWRCPSCQSVEIRAVRTGAARTAEELGRAFPKVRVIVSTKDAAGGVRSGVSAQPALVIATPGAEPVAAGGYAAAVLLDAASGAGLQDSEGDALTRWLSAAHLVIPARSGGLALLVGEAAPGAAAAFVRFDPVLFASRQLPERAEIGLPPITRAAELSGDMNAVTDVVATVVANTPGAQDFGPYPLVAPDDEGALFPENQVRALVRAPADLGVALARELKAVIVVRAAKREPGQVRVRLDPRL
ncbi:MAG: primosomal protein N', partial [Cellulomonadaceae bacterium]|nr:primosomal protein N' [Cellulomonadaceae bacterium]